MRRIFLVLAAAAGLVYAGLALAQSWETRSWKGGAGGAKPGAEVLSVLVAEDGAWPIVQVKSLQGFEHVLVVDIYEEETANVVGAAVALKQRGTIVPGVAVSVAEDDVVTIALRSFTDADTTAGELVLSAAAEYAVRRGGGSGVHLSPIVAAEDEPGTAWSVAASSDLGYAHRVKLSWALTAGIWNPDGNSSGTLHWYLDGDDATHTLAEVVESAGLYHGDRLIVTFTAASLDSGTVFATKLDTLDTDHGYKILSMTFANPAWEVDGGTGYKSNPVLPPSRFANYRARYTIANADSIYVDDDPTDGISAHAMTSSGADSSCVTADSWQINIQFYTANGNLMDQTPSRANNVYYDFEQFLPAASTIIEALLVIDDRNGAAERSFSASQGLIAMLDTFAVDSSWLSATTTPCNGNAFGRATSNAYQNHAADVGSKKPWHQPDGALSNKLNGRRYFNEFGISGPLTHGGEDAFTAGRDTVYWDVGQQIQYVIDYPGTPNNGFWLTGLQTNATATVSCGTHSSNRHYNPTLWITYREKPNKQAWNGYAFAYNFGMDDICATTADVAALAETYGARLTINTYGNAWYNTTADDSTLLYQTLNTSFSSARLNPAHLLALYNAGHEIANHSLSHGSQTWDHRDGDAGTVNWGLGSILADADSMRVQIARRWLIEPMGLPLADSLSIVKTFSYPNGGFGALAVRALAAAGYTFARATGGIGAQSPEWFATGGAHAATQETRGRQYVGVGMTSNLYVGVTHPTVSTLFGSGAVNTRAQVRAALDRAVDLSWRNGQAFLLTFIHDIADGPCSSYGEAWTLDQIGWVYERLAERGDVWYAAGDDGSRATIANIIDHHRSRASAVAAPADAPSALDDVTAEDGIYWYRDRWR